MKQHLGVAAACKVFPAVELRSHSAKTNPDASDTSRGEEELSSLTSCDDAQTKCRHVCLTAAVEGAQVLHAEQTEMGGTCSSIKAPVNYTVPWDVSARQHPRAMTELCGFSETLNQTASPQR